MDSYRVVKILAVIAVVWLPITGLADNKAQPAGFPIQIEELTFINKSDGYVTSIRVVSGTLDKSTRNIPKDVHKTWGYPFIEGQPKIESKLKVAWKMDGEAEASIVIDIDSPEIRDEIIKSKRLTISVNAKGIPEARSSE